MFSNPMNEISLLELLRIWAELTEAYHGKNGFGGDTAEIYAYRVQRYSPILHMSQKLSHNQLNLRADIEQKAGNTLVAIVQEFCKEYGCSATIDNIDPLIWCREINFNQRTYDHRAHITVSKE